MFWCVVSLSIFMSRAATKQLVKILSATTHQNV